MHLIGSVTLFRIQKNNNKAKKKIIELRTIAKQLCLIKNLKFETLTSTVTLIYLATCSDISCVVTKVRQKE